MLFTKNKPMEEILESLAGEESIFLLACNGCAESCGTGGHEGLSSMKAELEKAGHNVTASCLVDFLCNKVLVTTRLSREMPRIDKSDSILALTCGIGVQAVSKIIDKIVHPADDTVSLGGLQGLWPADERCQACGQCALDYTAGICPITKCAKSLLNGPCGGTQDGKCEIDTEKDCGWQLIYDRLKRIDRLEYLKKVRTPRDHSKMVPSHDLSRTLFYDVEK
ncbi:MAG: methylenetetrahydrofolate reductase C-terminal domain-containing protein [Planctomycetota bacterium]|jgi:hypothetical protein